MRTAGLLAAVVGMAAIQTACLWHEEAPPWTYVPAMRSAVPYESFSPHPLLAAGQAMRSPAPGSVARGQRPMLFGPGPAEAERAGRELALPFAPAAEDLVRGAQLYQTFCVVCHGTTGAGDGPLIPKIAPPPAYSSVPIRHYPLGRLVQIVTHGAGRMPAYGSLIEPLDRWRVALHVRTLQGSEAPIP